MPMPADGSGVLSTPRTNTCSGCRRARATSGDLGQQHEAIAIRHVGRAIATKALEIPLDDVAGKLAVLRIAPVDGAGDIRWVIDMTRPVQEHRTFLLPAPQ